MSKAALPADFIRKAERALGSARILLREQDAGGACNRAYYAMPDAAHAILHALGIESEADTIKTHHGAISAFGKHVAQGGLVDAVHGRAFGRVERIRQIADYTCNPPSPEEARACVEQAEAFVASIRQWIATGGT